MRKQMGEVIRNITRSLTVIAAVVVLGTVPVGAQSNGLGVSPRKDYTVEAGKTVADSLYIGNLSTDQDLQVRMRVIDFTAQNETGAPALQLGDDAAQTPWSLKPFLTIPASLVIPAGKSANIPVVIEVPAGQGAGSYYSAIEYTAVNPETKERVNVAASTVSLVFLTIPGEVTESMRLVQFGTWVSDMTQLDGQFASSFIGSAPKEFAYRLQNQGNVAEQPGGTITIKDIFGRTVRVIDKANPKRQLALRGQTRRFQVCIRERTLTLKDPNTGQESKTPVCTDAGLLPGRYTAEITLFYGVTGGSTQELRAVTTFWYLPWWTVVGLIILMPVAFFTLRRTYFNLRRRRRYQR